VLETRPFKTLWREILTLLNPKLVKILERIQKDVIVKSPGARKNIVSAFKQAFSVERSVNAKLVKTQMMALSLIAIVTARPNP
jgi:hypothetical protein